MSNEEQYELERVFNDAQNLANASRNVIEMMTDTEACDTACSLVNFNNSHLVAYKLAFNSPETAKALLEELMYYRKQGRI